MAVRTTATAAPAPPPNRSAPAAEPAPRCAARYAWAPLLARIYQVFPLRCTHGGGEMRIIAFVTDASTVRDILARLGEPTAPPRSAPARGPPLWEATSAEWVDPSSPWDPLTQPEPAYEFDQRIAW
jgi:hypothetical protein